MCRSIYDHVVPVGGELVGSFFDPLITWPGWSCLAGRLHSIPPIQIAKALAVLLGKNLSSSSSSFLNLTTQKREKRFRLRPCLLLFQLLL